MKSLQKFALFSSVLTCVLICQQVNAYEHQGLQLSAGIGANFSKNNFLEDEQSASIKINRGYNYLLDVGYGWNQNLTTYVSVRSNLYKSSLKDYDTPEPFWMQQSFIGPTIRYYLKSNEPSFYLQSGYGYGYFSVSDVANFTTSRHYGSAINFAAGYEVDMFWNLQIDYMYNDIKSNSIDNIGLTSHAITLSLNFNPRSIY